LGKTYHNFHFSIFKLHYKLDQDFNISCSGTSPECNKICLYTKTNKLERSDATHKKNLLRLVSISGWNSNEKKYEQFHNLTKFGGEKKRQQIKSIYITNRNHSKATLWTHSYSPPLVSNVPCWRLLNFSVNLGPHSCMFRGKLLAHRLPR
jgi:hypothetical protein